MTEIIIILSIGYIVYAFTKKPQGEKKRTKKGFSPWEVNNNQEFEVKFSASPMDIDVPEDVIYKEPPKKKQNVPHKKSEHLGTKTERNFYRTLQQIIPDDYVIHCQVSLMALVQPIDFKDNSKTWAKRIDYVITDKETKVLAVIELDDSSHRARKRQERDLYVNDALSGHHVLLRFEARRQYDAIAIANTLKAKANIQCRNIH